MTEERVCLNCGAPLTGEYCARCGQRDLEPRISVRDMAHEFVAEHFGLDSKVASTISTLVLHPGRLTHAFFQGRRVRFIPPLRLYLWSSVLFFLLLTTTKSRSNLFSTGDPHAAMDSLNIAVGSARTGRNTPADSANTRRLEHLTDSTLAVKPGDNAVIRFFKQRTRTRAYEAMQNQQSMVSALTDSFKRRLPDAVFLLVPVVAGILYLLYYRSGRYYAEHLVFALHVQAFAFVALMAILLPWSWIAPLVLIWLAVYLFIAMRTVYGQGVGITAVKFVVLTFSYSVTLIIAMAILGVIVFFFG